MSRQVVFDGGHVVPGEGGRSRQIVFDGGHIVRAASG
jgi:hypothetical protein